jgi:hypothetical protein
VNFPARWQLPRRGIHQPRPVPVHARREAYSYSPAASATPTNPDVNTYITRIGWNTGSVSDRQLTKAGQSLYYREPEGLAIQIPDTSSGTAACRLPPRHGFRVRKLVHHPDKMASFYYKISLV